MSERVSCFDCKHADWYYDLCNHPDADIVEVDEAHVPEACPLRSKED